MKADGTITSTAKAMSYQDSYGAGAREPGARRRKLAGYLKAANELRQSYQEQYAPNWSRAQNFNSDDYQDDTPGDFPDAAVVRSGEEEMILFPSYARKHVKKKPQAEPGSIQETSGDGRDVRDSAGTGDAEFWQQQWDEYEDDNAIVDVDVRGWIYSPFKGQMSRKQRLFIGLARQLVGIQAPPAGVKSESGSPSPLSSRDPSPGHLNHRERQQVRQAQRDEYLTAKEAEEILRKGEREAEMAAKGAYSEKPPAEDTDNNTLYRTQSQDSVRTMGSKSLRPEHASRSPSNLSSKSEENIKPVQKRSTWNQPADMDAAELAEANTRLMARLRHFLAIPMANTPISVFFYNDTISRQRTVYTNASGHFSVTAALDFIPTHVRILASDKLSATEEVIVTEAKGVSVISDIDDTIKHSAISSGAREIFRNAFIRSLGDLTIDGVKEWYNKMAEMGVKFHYVSNSPWQLYPVISKYFSMAGLPPGSFHLKQYSGMLQGIFEPVAERKKATLDKIARDFPERRFILIGDSGEADLEVYTDFTLENPGRVVAIFIRDVTTTEGSGFFDSSFGSVSGDRTSSASQQGRGNTPNRFANSTRGTEDDDPELKAAIQASLRDMEEEDKKRSKSIFPTLDEDHPNMRPKLPARRTSPPKPTQQQPNLIDLDTSSDDEGPETAGVPSFRRVNSDTKAEIAPPSSTPSHKAAPPPPRKPVSLRSNSSDSHASTPASPSSNSKAPPPPKPRRPSSTVHQSSPLAQQSSAYTTNTTSKPQPGPKPNLQSQQQSQQTYTEWGRDKIFSAYNNLPALRSTNTPAQTNHQPTGSLDPNTGLKKTPPPPPPARRNVTTYPVAAASYVGGKAATAWQNAPSRPHYHSNPTQTGNFSTSTAPQGLGRTNTSSTIGTLGANGNGEYPPGMNKREVLWRQRWARAEQVLGEKGVVLKSWRVGTDVMKDAEKAIKEAIEKEKKEAQKNSNGR
jgi:phosphatidate phosphatase APP1